MSSQIIYPQFLPRYTPGVLPDSETITLHKQNNLLKISFQNGKNIAPLLFIVDKLCTYFHKTYNPANPFSSIEISKMYLYEVKNGTSILTGYGFCNQLYTAFKEQGYPILFTFDQTELENERQFCINLDNIPDDFTFRFGQSECLEQIILNWSGIIHAPTGFGKMILILLVSLVFEKAKISIVCRRTEIVRKIVELLTKYLGNVGQVGAGENYYGERITVYTAASLHKADFDSDILIADEAHELVSDETSRYLAKFLKSRNFAFTATPMGRSDNADLRLSLFFGDIIYYLPYKEAVANNLVAPIKVLWYHVPINNPYNGSKPVQRERYCIWRNGERNKIIAQCAKSFPKDWQVQIYVKTVEHAVYLRQFLPEFTVVFDSIDNKDKETYLRKGLLTEEDLKITNPIYRSNLRKLFEQGKLLKVITTGVWAVGVDPVHLQVLIRADGSASSIVNIQVPGRASRINKNKECAFICDFLDEFHQVYAARARQRKRDYSRMDWEQEIIGDGQKYRPKEQQQ
jgi:superfamily II DNA or RNA helicase